MKRGKLIQWLHGFGRSHSAGRPRSHGSHTLSPSRRQPYLLRPRLEQLEERTLLSVVFVDDTATGLNNGTSWANAYKSLQSALTPAVPGTEIHVAQGTYKPTTDTDRTKSFALKTGVAIYGGYAGVGATDPDARNVALCPSILSGDIGTVGSTSDNSYHVVVGSGTNSTALLDGFRITAGNANLPAPSYGDGGGLYNRTGSPTLTNCTFAANSAGDISFSGEGGGMYNEFSASPTLINCMFTLNSVAGSNGCGGGISNYSSSPTLINCSFTGNSVGDIFRSGDGGGMYNAWSSPTLTNCTFTENSVPGSSSLGGGMYNALSSSPALTNCTFTANSARGTNGSGGGMYNELSSSPTLTNCTFAVNTATYRGGGIYSDSNLYSPKLTNCILWGNVASSGSQIYKGSSTPVVTYSDIQDWTPDPTNHIISADPRFVRSPGPGTDKQWGTTDDDYGDLRLLPNSPCIDAGNNAVVLAGIITDLAGNLRFADVPAIPDAGSGTAPIVDIGAYEFTTPPIVGTDGSDNFTLGLMPDHASIQIVSPGGTSTYAISALTSLRFTGGTCGDRLTVDFTNGNPVPAGGIAFDAGAAAEPGDSLIVHGTANGDNVVMAGNQVTVNGSVINSNGVEFFGFDLGEQAGGNLLGASGLYKAGPGTLVLSGTNTYSGGTTVEGGKVVVSSANSLPSGTNLVVNGGTVVLDTGLNQAVKVCGLRLNLGPRSAPTSTATTAATPTAQPAAAIVPLAIESPALPTVAQNTQVIVAEAVTTTAPAVSPKAVVSPIKTPAISHAKPLAPRIGPSVNTQPACPRWFAVNITPTRKFLTRTHLAPRDVRRLAERDEYVVSCQGNTVGAPAKAAASSKTSLPQALSPKQNKTHDAALQGILSPQIATDLAWFRTVNRLRTRLPVSHETLDKILAKNW